MWVDTYQRDVMLSSCPVLTWDHPPLVQPLAACLQENRVLEYPRPLPLADKRQMVFALLSRTDLCHVKVEEEIMAPQT